MTRLLDPGVYMTFGLIDHLLAAPHEEVVELLTTMRKAEPGTPFDWEVDQ